MSNDQSSSNRILSIYKSRMTILNFMERLNYVTSEYNTFSINQIDIMRINSQLDMLLTHATEPKKVYIKYYILNKQIRPQTLDAIIEDLYEIDNVLTLNDTLVIVIDEEPNERILSSITYIYENTGIFVVIHNIKRLQFNLLEHTLVPSIRILSEDEIRGLKKKYNLENIYKLPEISRFDPQALAVMLRPGEVVEFTRGSYTALENKYYRICINK
jgi:DNA-directed RNA polymerase subunit H (RpoH/RPB5)